MTHTLVLTLSVRMGGGSVVAISFDDPEEAGSAGVRWVADTVPGSENRQAHLFYTGSPVIVTDQPPNEPRKRDHAAERAARKARQVKEDELP